MFPTYPNFFFPQNPNTIPIKDKKMKDERKIFVLK